VSLNLDTLCYDPLMNDVDGWPKKPDLLARPLRDRVIARCSPRNWARDPDPPRRPLEGHAGAARAGLPPAHGRP
jgi:hypothetical protein